MKRFDWVSNQPTLSSRAAVVARRMFRAARTQIKLLDKAIGHRDRWKHRAALYGEADLALAFKAMTGQLPPASESGATAGVIDRFFPALGQFRQREYARSLIAELTREGTDTPEHVEHCLRAAHVVAEELGRAERDAALHSLLRMTPPPEGQ